MVDVFEAVSGSSRRHILTLLLAGERSVADLVGGTGLSQPAVSKQLSILKQAGMVTARAQAQRRWYRLCPGPFLELEAWLAPYRQLSAERLDALGAQLDTMED
jgi:DNA-binding transcriptional ArsR family regulator